ncbi:MAG: HAD family hydrolase [Spirochaetota bacterium]
MRYKLIVSDVDGCLAPEESAAWDFQAFSRLAALARGEGREEPLPLTLCTGRPQPYVEVLLKLLDVRLPAICEGGAVVYALSDNRSTYGPGVTPERLEELYEIRHFISSDLLPRYGDVIYQFGKEAQISLYAEDPARIPLLADEVRRFSSRFTDDPVEVSATRYYLNVSLRGVDKGSALRMLLADLGVRREDVASVGDTGGDLPLREESAFFGSPANATDEAKAHADYVSPYPDVHGLLDIIDHITR